MRCVDLSVESTDQAADLLAEAMTIADKLKNAVESELSQGVMFAQAALAKHVSDILPTD